MNQIENTNRAVCEYYDIPINRLYDRDRTAKATMARGYAIYILHKKYNYSIGQLSFEYNRIPRAIFWHVAKIKDYIQCYPKYKEIYNIICEKLK